MNDDQARAARVDKLIAEMETEIATAQRTTARMESLFTELGIADDTVLREMVRGGSCSPALQTMVEEDLARLDRELKDSEAALLVQTGHQQSRKPHRRAGRMTRV